MGSPFTLDEITPHQKDLRLGSVDLSWDLKTASSGNHMMAWAAGSAGAAAHPPEQTNGVHTPPHVASPSAGAALAPCVAAPEAIKAMSSKGPRLRSTEPSPWGLLPGLPGARTWAARGSARPPAPGPQGDGHARPPIARLGYSPSAVLGTWASSLYQSMNCAHADVRAGRCKDTKEKGRVKWKVLSSSSVAGPPRDQPAHRGTGQGRAHHIRRAHGQEAEREVLPKDKRLVLCAALEIMCSKPLSLSVVAFNLEFSKASIWTENRENNGQNYSHKPNSIPSLTHARLGSNLH